MLNFTHEWERDISEWDICESDKRSKFGAYYFMNYDCEFDTLKCTTNGKEESLSDIFGEKCYEDIRVVQIRYPPNGLRGRGRRDDELNNTISQIQKDGEIMTRELFDR